MEWSEGGGKWDNCNSIINKYIKKREKSTVKSMIQINDLEHKENINSQPVGNEETTIQKKEERIRIMWHISKSANIQMIGMP